MAVAEKATRQCAHLLLTRKGIGRKFIPRVSSRGFKEILHILT